MVNSIQNYSASKEETIGALMDEAVSVAPQCSFFRVKTIIPGFEECATALVLCAVGGTPTYKWFALQDSSPKRVPAATIRNQTVHEVICNSLMHGCDISCYTTDPDLYLYATTDPAKIDNLFRTILNN